MKTLAIIDLDTKREDGQAVNKMIVNNSNRAAEAQKYAEKFALRERKSRFYEKMFDPSLVELDEIEDKARTWLEMMKDKALIFYMTSRPHTMKAETEAWLERNGIEHPCLFKNYGSGQRGPDGAIDNGDRFVKTAAWKKREIQRLLDEIEPEWLIFADEEESNRAAIAGIGDPRILIRCSLEDAATHDFHRWEGTGGTPFLCRLQELANIMEMREAFESADQCTLRIEQPAIPGQDRQRETMHVELETWNPAKYGPPAGNAGAAEPGSRFYRYSNFYKEGGKEITHLEITCDQAGRVISVKVDGPGAEPHSMVTVELHDLYNLRDEEAAQTAQMYADEWIARSIEEYGYVAAAKCQRGMQLIGQPALDAYMQWRRRKNEEIKAALRGGHD